MVTKLQILVLTDFPKKRYQTRLTRGDSEIVQTKIEERETCKVRGPRPVLDETYCAMSLVNTP